MVFTIKLDNSKVFINVSNADQLIPIMIWNADLRGFALIVKGDSHLDEEKLKKQNKTIKESQTTASNTPKRLEYI